MRSFMLRVCRVVFPWRSRSGRCASAIDNLPTTPTPSIVTETFTGTLNINGARRTLLHVGERHGHRDVDVARRDATVAVGLQPWHLQRHGLQRHQRVVQRQGRRHQRGHGRVSTLGGSLCVRIYDVGSLTESVPYEIMVQHP